MPNSVVKPLSADGSVGSPHVRVGHRQALISNPGHWSGFIRLGVSHGERRTTGGRPRHRQASIPKPQPTRLGFFYVRTERHGPLSQS